MPEIAQFADYHPWAGRALPTIGAMLRGGDQTYAAVTAAQPVQTASLVCISDSGPIQHRHWSEIVAHYADGIVSARLPQAATAYFLTVTDATGAQVAALYIAR